MPLFGRNRQSAEDASLSANVEENDDGWRVTWFGNAGPEPVPFEAAGLTEVTDMATAAALAVYAGSAKPPSAVLAFAIYPLKPSLKGVLYDVSGGPGSFVARAMQGSHEAVEAATLEQLVSAARQQAGGEIGMLRWVRPFAELPTNLLDL